MCYSRILQLNRSYITPDDCTFGVSLSFPLWMYLHFATVHLWAIQDNNKKNMCYCVLRNCSFLSYISNYWL